MYRLCSLSTLSPLTGHTGWRASRAAKGGSEEVWLQRQLPQKNWLQRQLPSFTPWQSPLRESSVFMVSAIAEQQLW